VCDCCFGYCIVLGLNFFQMQSSLTATVDLTF
jgi:hypothetical protein